MSLPRLLLALRAAPGAAVFGAAARSMEQLTGREDRLCTYCFTILTSTRSIKISDSLSHKLHYEKNRNQASNGNLMKQDTNGELKRA
jgi:hypothetical protein